MIQIMNPLDIGDVHQFLLFLQLNYQDGNNSHVSLFFASIQYIVTYTCRMCNFFLI